MLYFSSIEGHDFSKNDVSEASNSISQKKKMFYTFDNTFTNKIILV